MPAAAQVPASADGAAPESVRTSEDPPAAETPLATDVSVGGDPAEGEAVEFAADRIDYDSEAEMITAGGNVVVTRGGYRLNADEVTFDRNAGTVTARGNVHVVDPEGNELFAGEAELDEDLRDGAIDGFLIVLQQGGRIAANSATRDGNFSTLDHAVYSPCAVVGPDGCPVEPLWQIKARSVTLDEKAERIRYRDAYFEFLGIPVLYLPAFSHADSSESRAAGLMVPSFRIDNDTGVSLSQPVYFPLSPSSDLTVAPTIYTEVLPALSAEYRRATDVGPLQVGGMVTYSGEERFGDTKTSSQTGDKLRGYFYSNGQFQFDPAWGADYGVRVTTDDTFLRRYDVSNDVTLRNFGRVQRIDANSALRVEGWAFQGLALDDRQGQIPIALPVVDYRHIIEPPVLGGRLRFDASSATVVRTDGMDTFRASAGATFERSGLTDWGQRVTATALVRGDAYRTSDADFAEFTSYAGDEGWSARAIPAAAIDVEWPLAGAILGGNQRLTPRVQLSASPRGVNGGIPNEDSRAFDLEWTNLFDISRFPGHDRWEGGVRLTYGAAYQLTRPNFLLEAEVGQSYSPGENTSIAPDGTGISDEFSDFVGQLGVRMGRWLDIKSRFRLDKDSLAVRRSEVELNLGGRRNYLTAGYLRLDRNIQLEDLQDREEVRAGGRLQLTRQWATFGSIIVDLTDRNEDPVSLADGFEPIRHRLGISYEDECFEFGVTWRRDYSETFDLERGSTFLFTVALKTIGR